MGHNYGRDNVKKRAVRRKKAERLAAAEKQKENGEITPPTKLRHGKRLGRSSGFRSLIPLVSPNTAPSLRHVFSAVGLGYHQ